MLVEQWGTTDILINAARGNAPGALIDPDQSLCHSNEEDLRKVMDFNQLRIILPCIAFYGPMIQNKKGVIINI